MDDGTAAMGFSALPAAEVDRARPDAMNENEVTSRAPEDAKGADQHARPDAPDASIDEPAAEPVDGSIAAEPGDQPPIAADPSREHCDDAPNSAEWLEASEEVAPDDHDAELAGGPPGPGEEDLPSPSRETPPIRIVEALLFASDTPLSAGKLAEMVGDISIRDMRLLIADLNGRYVEAGMSFRIEKIAGGYQMLTRPEFQPWLARLVKHRSNMRLTEPALETLAVVAYKQPVIRADVEAIRGVACGEVLNRLRELGLIRIVGRAEVVGRPILYGTTRKFLDTFGLASLDELPPMEALVIKRPRQPEPDEVESARPSRAAAGG